MLAISHGLVRFDRAMEKKTTHSGKKKTVNNAQLKGAILAGICKGMWYFNYFNRIQVVATWEGFFYPDKLSKMFFFLFLFFFVEKKLDKSDVA